MLASSFYRFYPMRAEGRIAGRHERYFADDAAAIAAAGNFIEDFPRLEIWCGARKVGDPAHEDLVRRPTPKLTSTSVLITRNKRLLHQAAQARHRTEVLCAQAALLASSSATLGLLHRRGFAVGDGLRCRFQSRSARLELCGERGQVSIGLLVEHGAGKTPGARSVVDAPSLAVLAGLSRG